MKFAELVRTYERRAAEAEAVGATAPLARVFAAFVDDLREVAADGPDDPDASDAEPGAPVEWTWRERLWACPAETRLTVDDVAEALGRSPSWVYKRTAPSADPEDRLPARKAHGGLVFTAGELRTWIRDHEEARDGVPMTTTDAERRAWSGEDPPVRIA